MKKDKRTKKYWKRRCELAEKYIDAMLTIPTLPIDVSKADEDWIKYIKDYQKRTKE